MLADLLHWCSWSNCCSFSAEFQTLDLIKNKISWHNTVDSHSSQLHPAWIHKLQSSHTNKGRKGRLTCHQAWGELAHRWILAGNWRGRDPTRDVACMGGPLASAQAVDQQDARLNYGGAMQSIAIASCQLCLAPIYRLVAFYTRSSESYMALEQRCCFLRELSSLLSA